MVNRNYVPSSTPRPHDTPDETWFSPWAPLPDGAYRGPFAKPTPEILQAVAVALEAMPVGDRASRPAGTAEAGR
ncbi:hypothetical protein DVH02_31225 [Streptomyces corynorhini]|uniref:Uncharacterized protein n=1 Tax=Streptomyces corynorhini TaxID=2282652 RepID=A0A370B199_9ACTN|nr:hypothetical protein DVH02_31225 [Streptomyces corynorhini]